MSTVKTKPTNRELDQATRSIPQQPSAAEDAAVAMMESAARRTLNRREKKRGLLKKLKGVSCE